jgi:hypothetical protein
MVAAGLRHNWWQEGIRAQLPTGSDRFIRWLDILHLFELPAE